MLKHQMTVWPYRFLHLQKRREKDKKGSKARKALYGKIFIYLIGHFTVFFGRSQRITQSYHAGSWPSDVPRKWDPLWPNIWSLKHLKMSYPKGFVLPSGKTNTRRPQASSVPDNKNWTTLLWLRSYCCFFKQWSLGELHGTKSDLA
jgi:hypothetical protein